MSEAAESQARLRADAQASRERILTAAGAMMGDRRMSMSELAAAAGVGRSTLYRHFPTRESLQDALEERRRQKTEPSPDVLTLPYKPPGQLGHAGLPLEVTHVLDEVPPHLIADQLVAEARRASGAATALYVVDIDGSQLIRLAGSEDFPEFLEAPPALGPEIVPEGMPAYEERLREILPRVKATGLWLRGRVIGLLICVGEPISSLADIAKQGAAALELAGDYTDLIESVRRRKPTSASAEVQQHLLPPRIARVTGAQIAGGLLPSYEVGGDWFDYVENRDGIWLAIADTSGTGATAAGLGAGALGGLRAARRAGKDLVEAADSMDDVVRHLGNSQFDVTAILARWHAPTGLLAWLNCGHPTGYVITADGELEELGGEVRPALGRGTPVDRQPPDQRVLRSGERLLLVTDGIVDRSLEDGSRFGVEGVRAAVAEAAAPTAAATAMAIQKAVTESWAEPLDDDASLIVLAVD